MGKKEKQKTRHDCRIELTDRFQLLKVRSCLFCEKNKINFSTFSSPA